MQNIRKKVGAIVALLWISLHGLVWGHNTLLRPVSFENLYIDDFFWYFQFRSQRINILPVVWQRLADKGLFSGKYTARDLEDADLYQLLETMSYIYVVEPDSLQQGRLDSLANLIPEKISQNTDFSWLSQPRKNRHSQHYQMAAFYRAALAYTRAGGQRPLLHWALENAEKLCGQILAKPERLKKRDLHPNMVLMLGDFYVLTQNMSFLKAASLMLDEMEGEKWGQEQGYYYAAQAWVRGLERDFKSVKENYDYWKNAVHRTMRITGGFSAQPAGLSAKRFGLLETIANMEWCIRLYGVTQDARCMDLYERALYNELRCGISFNGRGIAHNLEVDEEEGMVRDSIEQVPLRQVIPLIRSIAVLPNYYYATQNDTAVYINQYFRGEVTINTQKLNLKLSTMSSMPWEGGFYMDILTEKPQTCTFYLRVPSWGTNECSESMGRYRYLPKNNLLSLSVNGDDRPVIIENGFLKVSGIWKKNDRIVFNFLSTVRKIQPSGNVGSDTMRIAYQRAPFVFCFETRDSVMQKQYNGAVCLTEGLASKFALGMIGGVQTLEGKIYDENADTLVGRPLLLTPFFSKGQRGSCRTKIWFPYFTKDKMK